MTDGEEIHLGLPSTMDQHHDKNHIFKTAKAEAIEEFERRYLGKKLERAGGNLSLAARLAGQERSAFGKLVRKHNILRTNASMPLPDRYATSENLIETETPSHACMTKK